MQNSSIMSLLLVAALILASVIAVVKKNKYPERDYDELILRTKSWWWMIGLVLAALYMGQKTATIFFALSLIHI